MDESEEDITPKNAACTTRAVGELLTDAVKYLEVCGGKLIEVQIQAYGYLITFEHPNYDGCDCEIRFTKGDGWFCTKLHVLGPVV